MNTLDYSSQSGYDNLLNTNSLTGGQSINASNSGGIFSDNAIDSSKIKDLNVNTITVAKNGFLRSGKTSFTDNVNAGWFESKDGIYFGSENDTTLFRFTTSTGAIALVGGSIDATSTIGGRTASTLASAIDVSGHFADDAINTANGTILDSFTFGTSGAIQIGNYIAGVSGDIRISPTGILGRDKNNATTFSINAVTGVAVLNGLVVGTNVGLGTAQTASNVTTIIGSTVTTSFINALNVNAATVSASISITSPTISGGSISIGSGNSIFKANSSGIYLGNASFSSAPFNVDMSGNCIVNSLRRNDFHWFTLFESADGYQKNTTGGSTGSIVSDLNGAGLIISTGGTTNDYAQAIKIADNFDWSKKRSFKVRIFMSSNSNVQSYIGIGDSYTHTNNFIGFYINNSTIYGNTGDGTYTNSINLGTASSAMELLCVMESSSLVKFYINGFYSGQLTVNIPTGSSYAHHCMSTYIKTLDNSVKYVILRYWDFWQSN